MHKGKISFRRLHFRELVSGRTKLVLASPSVMGEALINRILQKLNGDIRELDPILEMDERRILEIVCGNSKMITFGELRALLGSRYIPKDCALQRVEISDYFETGGPMGFGFSKNFSTAEIRRINAILGMYYNKK